MGNHFEAATKSVMRGLKQEALTREAARKLRESRLMRLGVVVEQVMERGDAAFTDRIEQAALQCFSDPKKNRRDREVLGLDAIGSEVSFFDACRAKARAGRDANAVPRAAQPTAKAPSESGGATSLPGLPKAAASA